MTTGLVTASSVLDGRSKDDIDRWSIWEDAADTLPDDADFVKLVCSGKDSVANKDGAVTCIDDNVAVTF